MSKIKRKVIDFKLEIPSKDGTEMLSKIIKVSVIDDPDFPGEDLFDREASKVVDDAAAKFRKERLY